MYTHDKYLTMKTTPQARENYAMKLRNERDIAQDARNHMSPVQFMTCVCLCCASMFFIVMSLPA